MYQINNFNASSEREQAFCTILLYRFLSPKLSVLLVLLGVLFPSIEVFASYSTVNSGSTNSSVGVGGAIYQSCGACTDPDGLQQVLCGIPYTVKPLIFNLENNSESNLTINNIYTLIFSPNGQIIFPSVELYSEVLNGGGSSPLSIPYTVAGNDILQIKTRIEFLFCESSSGLLINNLPGKYTVKTQVSGIAGDGSPFTATVAYTFDGATSSFPSFFKIAPSASAEISALKWAPNPSTDIARLSFQLNEAGPVDIDILNLTGQIVEQRSLINELAVGQQSVKWNISHLAPGIYFARVRSRNEEQYVKWVKI